MSNFMKSIVAEVLERNHPAAALTSVTSPVTVTSPVPVLAEAPAPAPSSAPIPVPASTSASVGPSCSAGNWSDCLDTCSSPVDCPKPPGGIKRINYQKEQAGKRLALFGLPGDPGSTGSPGSPGSPGSRESLGSHQSHGLPGASPTPARLPAADAAAQLRTSHLFQEQQAAYPNTARSPAVNVPGDHRSFAERYLSPLLLRTLPAGSRQSSGSGQASIPAGTQHSGKNSTGDIPCRSGGIPGAGPTRTMDSLAVSYDRNTASPDIPVPLIRDGTMDAWLFPVISSRLRTLLGTAGRSYSSAGILSVPLCHPGQLFAAEELLGSDPALEADIQWAPAAGALS